MFLEYHNSLISRMLNQQHALAKLRAEIEEKKKRICWRYKRFRHLVHNYRNKTGEAKGKPIPQNKFEVIASRVMQYGVKEKVEIKQQERVKEVKCFQCQGQDTISGSIQILKLKGRERKKKKWHVWPDHKKHSKKGSRCIPIGKRHRNTVEQRMCQKIYSYWSQDR